MAEVMVEVVYFGKARKAANTSKESCSFSGPVDVQHLLSEAIKVHPALAEIREIIQILVNGRWASEDVQLRDGDRVAFVPPVGGG